MAQVITEEDTRNRLAQVAIAMRHCNQQRHDLDQKWLGLVAESICLRDRLDRYEVSKLGYIEDTA